MIIGKYYIITSCIFLNTLGMIDGIGKYIITSCIF